MVAVIYCMWLMLSSRTDSLSHFAYCMHMQVGGTGAQLDHHHHHHYHHECTDTECTDPTHNHDRHHEHDHSEECAQCAAGGDNDHHHHHHHHHDSRVGSVGIEVKGKTVCFIII